MYNADDFIKLIKKTALEAFTASKPANIVFGKVISVEPLKIKVDQKLILTSAQLVLSENVTDHKVKVTVDYKTEDNTHTHSISVTEGSGSASDVTHNHKIKGETEITVHNALKKDETVILMQVSGGQKYIVIDRIGKVESE